MQTSVILLVDLMAVVIYEQSTTYFILLFVIYELYFAALECNVILANRWPRLILLKNHR